MTLHHSLPSEGTTDYPLQTAFGQTPAARTRPSQLLFIPLRTIRRCPPFRSLVTFRAEDGELENGSVRHDQRTCTGVLPDDRCDRYGAGSGPQSQQSTQSRRDCATPRRNSASHLVYVWSLEHKLVASNPA